MGIGSVVGMSGVVAATTINGHCNTAPTADVGQHSRADLLVGPYSEGQRTALLVV